MKESIKKHLCKKCIDVVKRLRPSLGIFFDIQYVKKWVIQNMVKLMLIIIIFSYLKSLYFDSQRDEQIQNNKNTWLVSDEVAGLGTSSY